MTKKQINHGEVSWVEVYWDSQDPNNEGWAHRWGRIGRGEDSDSIDGIDDNDLDGAIEESCRQLGVELTPDQFAREPKLDGGFAIWTGE